MSLFEFPLPDIGEGVAEGEVTEWKVSAGERISEDQEICEVMTDKATVPISSPVAGTVKEILAPAGQVVPVGAILLTIEMEAGAHVPTVARHGEGHVDGPQPKPAEVPAQEVAAQHADAEQPEFSRPAGQRALATPYTRKLARTLGVDLEKVRGTGDAGRVTPDDVKAHAERSRPATAAEPRRPAPAVPSAAAAPAAAPAREAPKPARPAAAPGREERIPIRGLRKRIAERMHVSKTTAAHFTYVDEVDVTELVKLRSELKEPAEKRGVKLTYLPFIMKAVVSGLREFPTLNGVTDDAAQEFVVKHYYNLGVAVDTDAGLIVPVVKDVDRRSLIELANETARVAADAREGRSKLEDLQDSTFTITNAGNIGGLFATPVINYPEAAILGVHAIKRRPWIVGDEIAVRDIMYLSISIDHRMNDGATGARFMNHVIELLEDPRRILLDL